MALFLKQQCDRARRLPRLLADVRPLPRRVRRQHDTRVLGVQLAVDVDLRAARVPGAGHVRPLAELDLSKVVEGGKSQKAIKSGVRPG